MCQAGYHGIHPWHCGAKVSGVGEIVMTKGLLKFLSHLLKFSEIIGFLHAMWSIFFVVLQKDKILKCRVKPNS